MLLNAVLLHMDGLVTKFSYSQAKWSDTQANGWVCPGVATYATNTVYVCMYV